MLATVKGYYNGEHIVLSEKTTLSKGQEVAVTFFEPAGSAQPIADIEALVIPTERGKNVEKYMKEIRENDRF